jgi:putative hydrolase of the HAD superfamily
MILAFDLDDTLYPESTFVQSGFRAVAASLSTRFGWSAEASLLAMNAALSQSGRGAVFDTVLAAQGACSKPLVRECIKVYRHHQPQIALAPEAVDFLAAWNGPLYLVTDGHKVVQQNKVIALKLYNRFDRVFITHRYGLRHAKPSPYCFERIRTIESCRWQDLIYVGDNPAKDFISLNALGCITIRVHTGEHRDVVAIPGYDAAHHIASMAELAGLLMRVSADA